MTRLLNHPELKNLLLLGSTAVFILACSLKAGDIEKPAS